MTRDAFVLNSLAQEAFNTTHESSFVDKHASTDRHYPHHHRLCPRPPISSSILAAVSTYVFMFSKTKRTFMHSVARAPWTEVQSIISQSVCRSWCFHESTRFPIIVPAWLAIARHASTHFCTRFLGGLKSTSNESRNLNNLTRE